MTSSFLRRCIFFGSTNDDDFLGDPGALCRLGRAVLGLVPGREPHGLRRAGRRLHRRLRPPWRAQLNTDFAIQLADGRGVELYRSKSWIVGRVCALLAINLGGVFTLAYLLVVSIMVKGDV